MTRDIFKRTLAVFATMLALFGAGMPAQAAVYTGVWDPPYGPAWPNLGWQGQASFFVPNGCVPLAGSGLVDVYNDGEGCSGALVQSASVDLYTLDPCEVECVSSAAAPVNTLNFEIDAESLSISILRFMDGVLIGLQTSQSYGEVDNIVADPGNDVTFYLQFLLATLDPPPNEARFSAAAGPAAGYAGPLLSFDCCDGTSGVNAIQPSFVINRIDVPEPGSLALAALGLAGLLLGWGQVSPFHLRPRTQRSKPAPGER